MHGPRSRYYFWARQNATYFQAARRTPHAARRTQLTIPRYAYFGSVIAYTSSSSSYPSSISTSPLCRSIRQTNWVFQIHAYIWRWFRLFLSFLLFPSASGAKWASSWTTSRIHPRNPYTRVPYVWLCARAKEHSHTHKRSLIEKDDRKVRGIADDAQVIRAKHARSRYPKLITFTANQSNVNFVSKRFKLNIFRNRV